METYARAVMHVLLTDKSCFERDVGEIEFEDEVKLKVTPTPVAC